MLDKTLTGTLMGRQVVLREVSIGIALEANKQGTGFLSALFVLVQSAHWADTGEKVFASVDSLINDWPMSCLHEVNELATTAGRLNLGEQADAPPAAPNGAGVAPSH